MERRITLFADSLALPRAKDWGDIPFEKTYPYLLEQKLRQTSGFESHIFTNRAQRFNTLPRILEIHNDFITLKSADTVIIHCGIVDCAPRVFDEKQRQFVARLPQWLQRIVLKCVRIFRKFIIERLTQNKTYVTKKQFEAALDEIAEKSKDVNLIIINILMPDNDLEARSPNFQNNAQEYNAIIDAYTDKATIIDVNTILNSKKHTIDGMHPNIQGNQIIFEALIERILND